MAESEINVIAHLIEVEQKANELVKSVQSQSNEKLAQARMQAESDFNAQYETIVKSLEDEYNKNVLEISQNYKNQVQDYKSSVENVTQNKEAFASCLQNILESR